MSDLYEKLARLARQPVPASATPNAGRRSDGCREAGPFTAVDLQELLDGTRVDTAAGSLFVHAVDVGAHRGYGAVRFKLENLVRRLVEEGDGVELGAYAALRTRGLAPTLFIDLETGGLFGQPIFLAGVLMVAGGRFVIEQACVQDYAEEAALLAWMAAKLETAALVASYNGKSYDLPMLRDRAAYHRLALAYDGPHVDVLHLARRRYRHRFDDCRLTTLERHVCGRRRTGDVPGALVPGRFHRFLHDRDPQHVIPVLHHNVLDLVTLAELFCELAPDLNAPRFEPCATFFAATDDAVL